jgi:hypothetical protein
MRLIFNDDQAAGLRVLSACPYTKPEREFARGWVASGRPAYDEGGPRCRGRARSTVALHGKLREGDPEEP